MCRTYINVAQANVSNAVSFTISFLASVIVNVVCVSCFKDLLGQVLAAPASAIRLRRFNSFNLQCAYMPGQQSLMK